MLAAVGAWALAPFPEAGDRGLPFLASRGAGRRGFRRRMLIKAHLGSSHTEFIGCMRVARQELARTPPLLISPVRCISVSFWGAVVV